MCVCLRVAPQERMLSISAAMSLPSMLVNSAMEGIIEPALIRIGWSAYKIRRRCSSLGYMLECPLILLYVAAPTAKIAFIVTFMVRSGSHSLLSHKLRM